MSVLVVATCRMEMVVFKILEVKVDRGRLVMACIPLGAKGHAILLILVVSGMEDSACERRNLFRST
jgi:hypothetical protein